MDPIIQQVEQAYRDTYGRDADLGGLQFWSGILRIDPNFDLIGALQGAPEYELQQALKAAGLPPADPRTASAYNDNPTPDNLSSIIQTAQGGGTPVTDTGGGVTDTGGGITDTGGGITDVVPPVDTGGGITDVVPPADTGGGGATDTPPPVDTGGGGATDTPPPADTGAPTTDPLRQQVIDTYQAEFGRQPRQEALDFYVNALQQNPNFDLTAELRASPEYGFRQLYTEILGRQPSIEDVDNFLSSGATLEDIRPQLVESAENRTNVGQLGDIGGPGGVPLAANADLAALSDLAYTLATQGILDFPEYQVADLAPEQLAAITQFNAEKGIYEPYLAQGADTMMQGIGAMGDALTGTRDLAAQIPGQIAPGQAALGAAASDIQRFAGQGADIAGEAAQRARQSTAEAQAALQEASQFGRTAAEQGIAALQGSSDMYTPDMMRPFMNEYEDAAVQQALADIARQGEMEERQLEADAVRAGAFGGSRQAVAEQELFRNTLEQQGRTAAQMRNAGFESAATRSQQAFEDAMRRAQQGAVSTGQLGQIGSSAAAGAAESAGRLGLDAEQLAQTGGLSGAQMQMSGAGQAGGMGLQSANLGLSGIQAGLGAQQQGYGIGQGITGAGQMYSGLGSLAQGMQGTDLNTLLQMGQMQQAQRQAQLDAQRMNQYQNMMVPFQQLAFASDIMTGTPTGITSVMSQPIQGPSMLSQLGGLGLAAYGAGVFK
jgi:hypothetical protein